MQEYNIPNDEREMDRLDLQHHICLMTLGGRLGLALPCQAGAEVGRVLDLGTGTGIWAIEFGDDHPEAEVFGVDLSSIQPKLFDIDDLEEDWTYAHKFDYIHSRFMTSSIADWKDLLTKAFQHLVPGGYIELQEPDLHAESDDASLPRDCALDKYCDLLREAMVQLGREYVSVPALKTVMEEVGFVDVELSRYKWPVNTWPKDAKFKDLGAYNHENIVGAVEALAMAPFTRALRWSREEVEGFLGDRVILARPTLVIMAEVDHEINIVADEQSLEGSRADTESIASSSTSLSGSILDYRFENGRTYHRYKEGKYVIPNDEQENDRMDMQHHICLITLGGRLGLAPPCQPGVKVDRVLDVGTGTGIWAIQFGDDHPEAEVLGVDLSATQPDIVATNVKFEIDDIDEELTYTIPFDYIHSRFMSSSIAVWKAYLTKCFNHIQPGGYLELQEPEMEFQSDDGTFPADCPLSKYGNLLKEAAAIFGREYVSVSSLKTLMVEVGFQDVTLSRYKWPINTWPKDPSFKELGAWGFENSNAGLEAISIAPLTRAHKWTREEVNVFLAEVRKDLANKNYHTYVPMYFVVGRKPE
ncbi:TAM domain methyltransferase [Colletotrichum nymphaeae SA-01]|uniref:TAM domain methyltransferase n=1 Tax=Colletotrichum nymphaeae SA-01 TaxID=1460502 RepID=A0A135TB76_9PEZI|nr:TAM domain methyltransferase [Colletotrichum nymphaeae SA-01]